MEKDVNELTTILEKETQLQDALLQTAGDINQSLKDSDITLIQQHTAFYDKQIMQLEKIEADRIECCNSLAHELGLGAQSPVRLSRIITNSPESCRAKLKQVQDALKKKVLDLAKVNTSNRILIEDSLGIINNEFSMIRRSIHRETGYRQKGQKSYLSTCTTFINRVA